MTKPPSLDFLIDHLRLSPHPEGGYYRETWRSDLQLPAEALPAHCGSRSAGTAIYYLLPHDQQSALHRVCSDELWLFQLGDPLELRIQGHRDEDARTLTLGCRPEDDLQRLVPANHWQSARSLGGPAGYTLVACIVVPGFDFADFEMA